MQVECSGYNALPYLSYIISEKTDIDILRERSHFGDFS